MLNPILSNTYVQCTYIHLYEASHVQEALLSDFLQSDEPGGEEEGEDYGTKVLNSPPDICENPPCKKDRYTIHIINGIPTNVKLSSQN